MLAHRRRANNERYDIGRGKFRWGPRVDDSALTEIIFESQDALEEHPSDDEKDELALVVIDGVACEKSPIDLLRRVGNEGQLRTSERALPEGSCSGARLPGHNTQDSYDLSDDHRHLHDPRETSAPSEILTRSDARDSYGTTVGSPSIDQRIGNAEQESSEETTETEDEFSADVLEVVEETDIQFLSAFEGSGKEGVIQWERDHQDWTQLFIKHGLKFTVMDSILKNLKAPVKCWKTIVSNICAEASLESRVQTLATCPGHMCFADLTDSAETRFCNHCGSPKPQITASTSVQYIPVLPRIQAMLMDHSMCETVFEYHQTFQSDPGVYSDFFDCTSYHRIRDAYGGTEAISWDIFIAASTDGFQAYKNRTLDVWPVLAILLNLSPEQRYSVKNVLPLMFIQDGRQPTHLQSFLIPLINEINATLPNGVPMNFYDGSKRKVRLHLVWFSTDLDALTKIANLTGHNGKTPCRFCLIQGVYCPTSRHYYFPCSLRNSNNARPSLRYNPSSLPLRCSQSTKLALHRIDDARTNSERVDIAKETGIKGDSVLFQIPNFTPYISFPVDVMHLFYNLQKQFLCIHTGDLDDEFRLTAREIELLDLELLAFGEGISGQIAPNPRKLSRFHSWKAAEHKMFTLSYYMVLFDGYIHEQYMNVLDLFVSIADISFRQVLAEEDLQLLSKNVVSFNKLFEKHFMCHDRSRVKMSTYVMHLILHLVESVRENGPLVNTSQYWVERYIGWVVDRLHARRLPAASFRNAALFNESYKMLYSLPFAESEDDTQALTGYFQLLSPIRSGHIESTGDGGPDLNRLLSRYMIRKFEGMTVREAQKLSSDKHACRFWARIRFRANRHSTLQTAEISSRRSHGRPSSYVAAEMDVSETSADVYYGQLLQLIEVVLKVQDQSIISRFPNIKEKHNVAVINWARTLNKGKQHQVFFKGRRDRAFSSPTMEDVSIINRLVGVVQHAIPSVPKERRAPAQRAQQRTYFIDPDMRKDSLNSDRKRSLDGVNRILKGLATSR